MGGLTINPYNLNRDASGSSRGTAAAVASNFAVFGLGTAIALSIMAGSRAQIRSEGCPQHIPTIQSNF
ncbi:amidase family protein [Paenibacillus solisilvae]|uniref:Amidase family protein n=1 Tax=Paenibacillus solisilvae TaxID=2486751 RepID=A0ABW0VYS4_9BACL